MAEPDNPEDYVRFTIDDDLSAYVSRDLLEKQEPGTRKLRFYIGGHGGYWLELAEPWREDGRKE
ncbi:MAG TPA: hypothetical protein ENN19_09310 [Chloroflexi bacterium]|nr:hypothetical protein [Chloroflexota bacterium]